MPAQSTVTIGVNPDVSAIIRVSRIIARHLTALADELEAPDLIVAAGDQITEQEAERIRARFRELYKPTPKETP